MAEKSKEQRGVTRRQFMKAVPIGIASALVVSVISGRVAGSLFRRKQDQPQLPEDSIFAPAKDRRDRT
ncbi:MAG: twin-arginine translocation signal domain-containing protein [Chloroflexi bacterium]|nr:twin-arginine translocation signal domain-containing protein [Chloroflexota bacterium]